MTTRFLVAAGACVLLAGCSEQPTGPAGLWIESPSAALAAGPTSSDVPLRMSHRDAPTDNVSSDGLLAGDGSGWHYADGDCGTRAEFNLGDAMLDPDHEFSKKLGCTRRAVRLEFDEPVAGSGAVTRPTLLAGIHMGVDSVEAITDTALRWGQFNVSLDGCSILRFRSASAPGSHDLLVTRVTEHTWTVETQPPDPVTGARRDIAACLRSVRGNKFEVNGLYHMPFKVTMERRT